MSEFPAGGGDMGALIRSLDWAKTPLGPIDGWSPLLKGAVNLMLPAQAQIVMFWGAEFVALYNDAYAPTIGDKHPRALGRPACENWAELWDDLEPLLQQARAGKTVVAKDRPFSIERRGYLEQVYFDISYSPARNEANEVEGIVCIVAETTERVLDDRRARESGEQLQALAQALPNQVWTALADGEIEWFNNRVYAYGGAAAGILDGDEWGRLVHPDDVAVAKERWAAALRSGKIFETEFRLRRADGAYRWHLGRAVPIHGSTGGITRWIGTNTDIDDQRVAAEALRHLNEDLERQVAQRTRERDRAWLNAQDLLVMLDSAGNFQAANPAWRTILGWAPGELVGRQLLDFVHPDDRASSRAAFAHASATLLNYYENRCRHADGSYRWIGWLAAPEGGLIYATGRNVTTEKEQAAALERSEARLRSVFETSYQYQGFMTPEGTLLDANPTSLAGIEARLEDVVGQPFWETPWFTATPGLPEQVQAAIPLVAAGEAVRQEIVVNLPTGRRAFDFSMRPVFNPAGVVIAIVPEAMEVTERRAAEEQLRQAQKMEAIGQLTGGIAHDFNNMLTGITGALELIQRRLDSGRREDLDRYIETGFAAAQRAAALTHRLLAFARRQALDTKPQDVNALVGGMEDMLRRTLGERINLKIAPDPKLWPALTDANQFESAILNLAINARDAMPEGGYLTIETSNTRLDGAYAQQNGIEAGDYVLVSVSDTGSGMPADVIEKAFDPFFTTKPIGQGTGLGLSMIYGFVKQSGGHVRLYSEVGQGTTVRLYMRRATSEIGPSDTAEGVAAQRGNGETVLVVEDDPGVRLLIVEVLEELGYRYFEAADADAAVVHLDAAPEIDLMVTDVGLPNINGRQLAEMARRKRPTLKVLFITGYAEQAAVRTGLLPDGMEILGKPFSLDALASKIRELLD